MLPQPTSKFQHRFARLIVNLFVVGDRFLGFRGELHVGARQMDKDGGGAFWHTASTGLVKSILTPIHRFDGFGQHATALLVHQRHAVGEAEHLHGGIGGHAFAKDEPDLDLEGVALAHGRDARERGHEAGVDRLREPLLDEHLFDGRQAIHRRFEQANRFEDNAGFPLFANVLGDEVRIFRIPWPFAVGVADVRDQAMEALFPMQFGPRGNDGGQLVQTRVGQGRHEVAVLVLADRLPGQTWAAGIGDVNAGPAMVEAEGTQVASHALEGLGQGADLVRVHLRRFEAERAPVVVDEPRDLAHFLDGAGGHAGEFCLEEDADVGRAA